VSDDLVIRRAEPADVPGMARLAGALVRMHHRVDPSRFLLVDEVEKGYGWWFGREIARPEAVAIVALRAGSVVGYAYGTLEERDWNLLLDEHGALHDVFVDETARGHGVGQRLVREAVAALEELGAPRVILSTMVSNETAQRLFRRCGFRPTMLEMTRDGETVASPKSG
jgi:ribosomal protein S18 acetylase RimI-like enzyme